MISWEARASAAAIIVIVTKRRQIQAMVGRANVVRSISSAASDIS